MTPEPKYKVGDVVFAASAENLPVAVQCPDCLGTKEWECSTPAGDTFHVDCSTCHAGYFCTGTVQQYCVTPVVLSLTIGSVRVDTHDGHPVSYMANETGVGSGRVWHEERLVESRENAQAIAESLAIEMRNQLTEREAARLADKKKAHKRKPSWEKRKIRELEQQLKALSKEAASCL